MGFNLSTFRCGQTLQDTDLNAIVNAINSIYNAQGIYIDSNSNSIKLTDNSNGNITKSELQTFLGINENNENYIPISGSSNISGWLTPSSNDGCGLGSSSNYWSNVNASETNTKEIKFYAGNAGINTREGDEIIAPLGQIGDPLKASINSEEPEGTSQKKTVLVYDNKILASRDWIKKGFDTQSIYFVHYDEDSRKYINCGGITADVKTDADDNKIPFIEIWSEEDVDTNVSQPIHFINWDTLKGKPSGIKFGENQNKAGDVLTVYDGKIYINDTLYGGGTGGVSSLNDLSGVSITDSSSEGQVLYYDGEKWTNSFISPNELPSYQKAGLNDYLKIGTGRIPEWVPDTMVHYSVNDNNVVTDSVNIGNGVKDDTSSGTFGANQILARNFVTTRKLTILEHDFTNNTSSNESFISIGTYGTAQNNDQRKYIQIDGSNIAGVDFKLGTNGQLCVNGNPIVFSQGTSNTLQLDNLSDVSIGTGNDAPTNGQVLVYDSSSSNWKNASLPTGNLPPTTGKAAGDYLVLKDNNGTLEADWTNVTSNITDVMDTGMVDPIDGGKYYRNYKLKTSGGTTTGTGININTLPPAVDSQDNILTFKNGFVLNGTNGASIIFPNIQSTNKISLVNTAASGSTGSGKIAYLEYNGNNINIDTYTSISAQNHETAGTAKLYLNGTEIGIGGSGLTGIGYKNSNDSTATSVATSGQSFTLKAGNNVSFTNSGTELTINASVTNSGGISDVTVAGTSVVSNGTAVIPKAGSTYGVIKAVSRSGNATCETANSSSTTQNYKVQVDNNGVAFVNVPWTATGLTSGNWANYLNSQQKDTPNLSSGYLYYTSGTDSLSLKSSSPGSGVTSITPGTGLLNGAGNQDPIITSGTIEIDPSVVINNVSLASLLDALFVGTNIAITGKYTNENDAFTFVAPKQITSSPENSGSSYYFYVKGTIDGYVNPILFHDGSNGKIKLVTGVGSGQGYYESFPDNSLVNTRVIQEKSKPLDHTSSNMIGELLRVTSFFQAESLTAGTDYQLGRDNITEIFNNGLIKYYINYNNSN